MNKNIFIQILKTREKLERYKLFLLKKHLIKKNKKIIKIIRILNNYYKDYSSKLNKMKKLGIISQRWNNCSNFLNVLQKEIINKNKKLVKLDQKIIKNDQNLCRIDEKLKQWTILQAKINLVIIKKKRLLAKRMYNEVLQYYILRR
ncbi:hypothetical protein HIC20_02840 [Buchnera aphidicola (Hormaphis cornu)]|nr:hypothetical protein HIC20_02840 [Buchnera aphidicola (Hormaphis cornu)]